MYKLKKSAIGQRVSLFIPRLPKSMVLDEKTSQSTLKVLHELGVNFIEKVDGDNKG